MFMIRQAIASKQLTLRASMQRNTTLMGDLSPQQIYLGLSRILIIPMGLS